ncbi:superoxide dismutase [Candidatus Kaiserbacteria bacterium]|nr:superoxide dismutase [Candidatus Kaiserbacteria bacterium]
MTYTPKTFNLPALEGISEKQIKVHLALYEGYVKHVNLITEQIQNLKENSTDPYVIAELRRRFAFEFDGMRMHELYFAQLESGVRNPESGSPLVKAADVKYGNGIDGLTAHIKEVSSTRGIGWVVVYKDSDTIHTTFVGDHEVGQLAGLPILLALDLWEHAYMVDYVPAEKKNYIDAFFANLNWSVIEKRF